MHQGEEPVADINITPFVDVVLVLLVIFMVTAPALMQQGLKVQLPESQSSDTLAPESVGVTITSSGQLLLAGRTLDPESFRREVINLVAANPQIQAMIRADRESKHQSLILAMDLLKQAGLNKFALEIQVRDAQP